MDKVLAPARAISHPKENRGRIFEVDFLRGVAICLMVLLHFCYTLGFGPKDFYGIKYGDEPEWFVPLARLFRFVFCSITQPSGFFSMHSTNDALYMNNFTNLHCLEVFWAGMFMFLAGLSCTLSKNNFKRGLNIFMVANLLSMVLELGSDLIEPFDMHIWCGILHALGIAIMLFSLYDHFLPKWWQTFIAFILLTIVVGFIIPNAYVIDPRTDVRSVPSIYPELSPFKDFGEFFENMGKLFIGLVRQGDDYFSPVLVTTAVFGGASVGKTLYKKKKSLLPSWFKGRWGKPICFVGRHTLIIYAAHQVVGALLLIIVMSASGVPLDL